MRLWFTLAALVYLTGAFYNDWMLRPSCHCSLTAEAKPHDFDQKEIKRLKKHVEYLSSSLGERNQSQPQALAKATAYVKAQWQKTGVGPVHQSADRNSIWIDRKGSELPNEVILLTARLDSASKSSGANFGGSGLAALIELVQRSIPLKRTVRWVALAHSLPPSFDESQQGLRQPQEKIAAAISLGSLGYYSADSQTQHFPAPQSWMYPHQANFIQVVGFLGDVRSRGLVNIATQLIHDSANLNVTCHKSWHSLRNDYSEELVSLQKHGFPTIEITDTGSYRFPNYLTDTSDHLDYRNFSEAVRGIGHVIEGMANDPGPTGAPNIG